MHRIALAGLALLAVLIQGCPSFEKTGAQGSSRDISVFTNVDRDSRAYRRMEEIFVFTVNVVRQEQFFVLDPAPFDQFRVHRLFKNQIFLVDLSRDDDLARKLPGFLGERGRELMRAGDPFRFLVRDTWALGQTTLFLVAHTETQLTQMLEQTNADSLRKQFEESVYDGLAYTLYALGERESLTRRLAGEYGWDMRLLPEYSAAADPQGNFIKFDAQTPVRLILVHWEPGELPLNAQSWRPMLDRILFKYNDGDEVSDPDTHVFTTTFQDLPALKWEGVWQNEKYIIGGAFRAYAVHRDGRSFLLIAMVYNPAGDKVPALIQTEAILRTFEIVE